MLIPYGVRTVIVSRNSREGSIRTLSGAISFQVRYNYIQNSSYLTSIDWLLVNNELSVIRQRAVSA
jgi:hypothetical protein